MTATRERADKRKREPAASVPESSAPSQAIVQHDPTLAAEIVTPLPGIYRGVKPADYFAWPAFSNSLAGHMLRSAAHGRYYLDNPPKPTKSMQLGTAVDSILFHVEGVIAVKKKVDGRTTAGRTYNEEFEASKGDKTVVDEEQWAAAQAMADSVALHPAAGAILDRVKREDMQVAIVWIDKDTGVLCKGLIDMLSEDLALEADLKSTTDASPREFPRSIFSFGYHRQRAMYAMGLAANGVFVEHNAIVAVENEPPYLTAVYRVMDEDLDRGRLQLQRAIRLYAECMKTGTWPGYSPRIQDIALPHWSQRQIDDEGVPQE